MRIKKFISTALSISCLFGALTAFPASAENDLSYDINNDGVVDLLDLYDVWEAYCRQQTGWPVDETVVSNLTILYGDVETPEDLSVLQLGFLRFGFETNIRVDDVNNDGVRDLDDFKLMIEYFNLRDDGGDISDEKFDLCVKCEDYVADAYYQFCFDYRGDVNLDGQCDARDVSLMLTYYADEACDTESKLSETEIRYIKALGDFNQDGIVNPVDASYILTYYAEQQNNVE